MPALPRLGGLAFLTAVVCVISLNLSTYGPTYKPSIPFPAIPDPVTPIPALADIFCLFKLKLDLIGCPLFLFPRALLDGGLPRGRLLRACVDMGILDDAILKLVYGAWAPCC